MDFHQDPTLSLLRDQVRRFVQLELSPHITQFEQQGYVPRAIFEKAGALGLLGVGYPEALGGSAGGFLHKLVIAEEFMRAGSGGLAASLGSLDIALPPIIHFGPDWMKQKVVPKVLRGEKIAALAITEPSGGSDVANMKTRAKLVDDYYLVNGSKTFITSGFQADYYTVAVRTGTAGYEGISLLLIEKNCPGFSTSSPLKKMGWRASDTAELYFDQCKIPKKHLIGAENQGFYAIMHNFQAERLSLAIMANMTSQLALDACLDYVKQRQAFGKLLSGFQVTRHTLADMASRLAASQALTYQLAQRLHQGEKPVKDIAMAKNIATDTSTYIVDQAVQLFGGLGYMEGTLVERLYRDNRILSIGGGTREIMNEIISKELLK